MALVLLEKQAGIISNFFILLCITFSMDIQLAIQDFFYKYFIYPIQTDSGFNLINTLVYAIIGLVLLFLWYKVFRRLKIEFNTRFLASLIPFIALGSTTRAFVDHGYYGKSLWVSYVLTTPGIYLLIGGLFLGSFFISYLVQKYKQHRYWQSTFIAGILFNVINIGYISKNLGFGQLWLASGILAIFFVVCLVVYFISKTLKLKFYTEAIPFSAIAGQVFDGVNTVMITQFIVGAVEKHPIPRWLIKNVGSWSFLVLKLAFVLPAVWLVSTQINNKNLRNYLLITIGLLGLAEGLRNFVSLILV